VSNASMRKGGLACVAVALAIGCSSPQQRPSSNKATSQQPIAVPSDLNQPPLRCELRTSEKDELFSPTLPYHLHFLLFWQTSGVNVYEDWNSWGYGARWFVARDAKGRTYELERRGTVFTKNYPSTVALNAGDFLITDVFLCDGSWLVTPKLPSDQRVTLSLTARFTIRPREDPVEHRVWTGELQSDVPIDVYLGEDCVRALNAKDDWH